MVQINDEKRRGYRLVREFGIITVIFPSVKYRLRCEMCKICMAEGDPSAFADWNRIDKGAICPRCARELGDSA